MPEIPYLRLVSSKGSEMVGDCGICAIGTMTGQTYEDVVAVASRISKNWKGGLYLTEIVRICQEFGLTLYKRRKYDLETDVGILNVDVLEKEKMEPHVVVLNAGQIIDSDCTLWTPDAFISNFHAKLGTLLSPDKKSK